MMKPLTAAGYPPAMAQEARRMALYVATILGDLADSVVIVGGLVPYLIIDQEQVPERHVGTRDLDLGLSVAVLDQERYREISQRLRDRGFAPTQTRDQHRRRQTWRLHQEHITVDFLIGPTARGAAPGRLQNLERDFAAIVTPALPLAFTDSIVITIDDRTPTHERARRTVRVCGPAAFTVLKAHALRGRGENKDAYDLVYVLLNYGERPLHAVADRFALIATDEQAQAALRMLAEDFATDTHLGPRRRAEFLGALGRARTEPTKRSRAAAGESAERTIPEEGAWRAT